MRTIQVFIITLCLAVGLYLLTGRGFSMPGRWDPSISVQLTGSSARMLGAALLIVAGLGVTALRNFGGGLREHRPYRWHVRYFMVLMLSLALIIAAFVSGEKVPTPGWRPPASAAVAR